MSVQDANPEIDDQDKPTYYVTHMRVTEKHGSITEEVLAVYEVRAWGPMEATKLARGMGALPETTYEYLHASKLKPYGVGL